MNKGYSILLFFILIGFSKCSTKRLIIDAKQTCFIAVNHIEKINVFNKKKVYEKNNFTLVSQGWKGRDVPRFINTFIFVSKKDTMKLTCLSCNEQRNYYLKDLKFKEGIYDLIFPHEIIWIKGSDLPTNTSIQNIYFKRIFHNTPNQNSYSNSIENVYFKDLYFQVIDFSDKENIELKPISNEKEF